MEYPASKKSYPTFKSQTFTGVVVEDSNNKLRVQLNNISLYNHFLFLHCKKNDIMTMTLTNKKPKRTQAQNDYYHLYLSLICLSSGHSLKEIKAWVQKKYLSKGVTEVFGEKVRIVTSSSDLNISEMIELIEKIHADTEIPLPDPEPFKMIMSHAEYARLKDLQKMEYKNYESIIKIK